MDGKYPKNFLSPTNNTNFFQSPVKFTQSQVALESNQKAAQEWKIDVGMLE